MQYYCHDFRAAVATCRDILQHDPYHLTCLPVYLCTLHELQQKNELFYRKLLARGCSNDLCLLTGTLPFIELN